MTEQHIYKYMVDLYQTKTKVCMLTSEECTFLILTILFLKFVVDGTARDLILVKGEIPGSDNSTGMPGSDTSTQRDTREGYQG